jgi:uridine phosphorylase
MSGDREYHIGIAPGEIPEVVLLPGDPDRAKMIAERFFKDTEEIARKREYWSFRGTWNKTPVAVCSTGIGCPSAAIAIEELIKVGCSKFVRVGTCGAINKNLMAGDLVIFVGAVRDDGTSRQYVPIVYPAVADPDMVLALEAAARARNVIHYVGVGHSKDAFYSEYPEYVADPESVEKRWRSMRKVGVLATEMEAAALFVIGQLRQVKVGTVCVVVGENIEREVKIQGSPPLDNLVSVALDALTTP